MSEDTTVSLKDAAMVVVLKSTFSISTHTLVTSFENKFENDTALGWNFQTACLYVCQ